MKHAMNASRAAASHSAASTDYSRIHDMSGQLLEDDIATILCKRKALGHSYTFVGHDTLVCMLILFAILMACQQYATLHMAQHRTLRLQFNLLLKVKLLTRVGNWLGQLYFLLMCLSWPIESITIYSLMTKIRPSSCCGCHQYCWIAF